MKEKLLLALFFVLVAGSFVAITISVTKVFVASINSTTASYFPEENVGINE
jgi:hypothetical protein